MAQRQALLDALEPMTIVLVGRSESELDQLERDARELVTASGGYVLPRGGSC
jgi:hypothetical protein